MRRHRGGDAEPWHRSRSAPLCGTITLDVDLPIEHVPMDGARLLHVTALTQGRVIGSTLLDAAVDPFPGTLLASAIAERFGAEIHARRLSARFGEEAGGGLPRSPTGTVVICTRDRPEALRRCLARVAALAEPTPEVIVVDNSARGVEGLRRFVEGSGCRYVHEPQAGLSRARNRGALEASSDVILYADDDVEVHPRWASSLLACFADPLVMTATGLVLPAELDTPARFTFERVDGFGRGVRRKVVDGCLTTPFVAGSVGAGASMAIRRSFFELFGGFPEDLGTGLVTGSGEDTYLLYRVLSEGFRAVYEPAALSTHHHRETMAGLGRQLRGYGLGVVSWHAYAGLHRRDLGAVTTGVPIVARYFGARAVKSILRTPDSLPRPLARAELAGVGGAPRALLETWRELYGRPQIRFPEPAADPTRWFSELAVPGGSEVAVDALPSLSVVIPTRGRRDLVVRLLRALDRLAYPDDRLELIVSIDGDLDGSERAIAAAGLRRSVRTVVLDAPPSSSRDHGNGAGHARNEGARIAAGEVLVFLDDDVVPLDDRLLLEHGAAHATGSGAVVGPSLPATLMAEGFFAQQMRSWFVDYTVSLLRAERLGFAHVSSANLSIDRATFEQVGGFVTRMPRREDWELGFRLMEAEIPIRSAPTLVRHDADLRVRNAVEDRRREGAGDLMFAEMHPQALAWLPLASWDGQDGVTRRVVRALFADPSRFDAELSAGVQILRALERLGLRRRFAQLLGRMNVVAYWSGVASAAGGEPTWHDLRAEARAVSGEGPPFDLAREGWTSPPVRVAPEVAVLFDGMVLGTAPWRWGGVPWVPERFRGAVAERFADDALRAEVRRAVGAA